MFFMSNIHQEQNSALFPSLTFKAGKYSCAMTARHVSSIMLMPDSITPMPHAPDYCKGMVDVRGYVVPLIDLRTLFGLPTLQSEHKDFCALMDTCKQDHKTWVETLRAAIENKTAFELADDPHKCRLGRWYDNFSPSNQSVRAFLKKLEDPHEKFHQVAQTYNEFYAHPESAAGEDELRAQFEKAVSTYMPLVLNILEEAKEAFLHEYQSILIVMENDGINTLSFVVDSVDAIEIVTRVPQSKGEEFWHGSQFITGIGKSERGAENILMIDDEAMLTLAETIETIE